ncbi:carboxymuconolactone decarboxylase family protein [Actinoalloteichus hymeniacidonis]|uniref:Alkylhydroperoxidase AhpD family core domain n=1 Tax=Actinoalloteichus hymeniacidonis TaxID=340345 RepID=A0AAC9HM76_9PSEU|nr:carboxymuconolactone decarboxylase family protein [Actinoalloteichus hymeniacidonis]AOS61683.1 alkylhydroperoxidase AhpD family core domain [Actinoalloteichus hymeniacidonis]MBB5910302.1 AhpD family alkylhydroperoxidase [Actinoalloteichus hymeniacidonis]
MEPRINLFANGTGVKISKRIYAVSRAIEESTLPRTTRDLVQLRASQINGCGYCVDLHAADSAATGESPARLSLVAAWRHSSVFTEAERAALRLAEEGTRIADAAHGVSDDTWSHVREHYDQDQAVALVALIAMINATNRLGVILNIPGGSHDGGSLASMTS